MNCAATGPDLPLKAPPLRCYVHAALAVSVLFLTSGIHAAGLFLPVEPAADVALAPKSASFRWSTSDGSAAWERRVRIARHELTTARDDVEFAGAGPLLLNVKDDVRLDVVVERTAPTQWGYSLSGRVAGGGVGFVTLVAHKDVVAGSIWTPSASYELLPVGGGIHSLRDVTKLPPVECEGMPQSELEATNGVVQGVDEAPMVEVVDILVVYTPAAEEEVRSWTDSLDAARIWIEAFNDMAIALTNDAFERSGAFVSLNLVGIERVDYEPATREEDWKVVNTSEPIALRDRLRADLFHATVGCCGGAAGIFSSFLTAGSSAIFVAHEIGHNFENAHERHERNLLHKAYGNGFTTERCNQTIMSYGTECYSGEFYPAPTAVIQQGAPMMPFFASPWRYWDGLPLGVNRFSKERGARGPADAVLSINRNRHRIANFRQRHNGE